ncbi:MAG TPA: hypothetical protein VD965_05105 [Burkholderiales bacterium]|nr:hypothetical protein [Burkholderiales bacterium]
MKTHAFVLTILLGSFAMQAFAAEFKTIDECKPGRQVQDRKNRVGTVTKVLNGSCVVRVAGVDGDQYYPHWMLRPAGASQVTSDKLVNGVYKCYHSGGYAFIDIHIDGPSTYRDKKGKAGKYKLDAGTGKIVFESGTLRDANAKLFNGPKIGLNMDGKSVYSVTCGLSK